MIQRHIVTIQSGKVRGHERDGIIEYLGIPYAQPPLGKLRFKRSKPALPWEGVYDAKNYIAEAVQLDGEYIIGNEDCLSVNIQAPKGAKNLPVFVYIHGGGYATGGSNVPLYNGREFAKKGIVYVSFQYRLNIFGFYDFTTYKNGQEFDSNCGLSDQILAMQWIRDNIKKFGGDPTRTTICGESAGGSSVVNLLVAPSAKGTFQQAIIQSGLVNCISTHQQARENIDLFIEGMGWTEEDLLQLKTLESSQLMKGHQYVSKHSQAKNPGYFLPGPVQDDLLPMRPLEAIQKGSVRGIRIILGCNAHEGTTFVRPIRTGFPSSWEMVSEMFKNNALLQELPNIVHYYSPFAEVKWHDNKSLLEVVDNSDITEKINNPFTQLVTDYVFQMPTLKLAETFKDNSNEVWLYRYDLITASGKQNGMGASHAYDLPAMFANQDFEFSRYIFEGENEEVVHSIIENMHGDWVRFIKSGNPNLNWECYKGYETPLRIYDRESYFTDKDFSKLMEVWKDMRFYEG